MARDPTVIHFLNVFVFTPCPHTTSRIHTHTHTHTQRERDSISSPLSFYLPLSSLSSQCPYHPIYRAPRTAERAVGPPWPHGLLSGPWQGDGGGRECAIAARQQAAGSGRACGGGSDIKGAWSGGDCRIHVEGTRALRSRESRRERERDERGWERVGNVW